MSKNFEQDNNLEGIIDEIADTINRDSVSIADPGRIKEVELSVSSILGFLGLDSDDRGKAVRHNGMQDFNGGTAYSLWLRLPYIYDGFFASDFLPVIKRLPDYSEISFSPTTDDRIDVVVLYHNVAREIGVTSSDRNEKLDGAQVGFLWDKLKPPVPDECDPTTEYIIYRLGHFITQCIVRSDGSLLNSDHYVLPDFAINNEEGSTVFEIRIPISITIPHSLIIDIFATLPGDSLIQWICGDDEDFYIRIDIPD